MTWEEATDKLLAHFKARWEAVNPSIPVQYPNTKPVSASSSAGAWLRLSFTPSFSRRIAVGGQLRAQGGQVVVNTFTPLQHGDGDATAYGRTIESIWEQAKANGLSGAIHLGAPEPLPGTRDPDIPAWRSGVAISFTFDHAP